MANILIIDDSDTVRTQLKNHLAREGYRTLEAANGLDGLNMLERNMNEIDLIFCDVNMPEMDGLTMCRELRRIFPRNRIPIFMLTTQTNASMKAEGKASGVVAWIVKPYDKHKLMRGVARVLGRLTD